jgi:hypothetical protein
MQFWTNSIDYTNDSFQKFISKNIRSKQFISNANHSYELVFSFRFASNQFPFLESLLQFSVKHKVDYDNGQQSDNGKTDHFDAHQFSEALS